MRVFEKHRKRNRWLMLLGGFLVGILVGSLITLQVREEASPDTAARVAGQTTGRSVIIERVVDGDTVNLPTGETVRLLGIDTPEFDEPCYKQARDHLSELVRGKNINMTLGPVERDRYDRLLAWLWDDELSINLALVEAGLARASLGNEELLAEELTTAEQNARERKLGCLWAGDNNTKPAFQISPEQASQYVGEQVTVIGTIDHVYTSAQGNLFINFCEEYRSCDFSAVIFSKDQHRFDALPSNLWAGREVQITGGIQIFEGRPEIMIIDQEQIVSNK